MNTKEFILEKVTPIFNKKGYVATSLSDLTVATGLTKGAIYCNFENKEDLAIQAFSLNVKRIILPLAEKINKETGAIQKLYALTHYYRSYYTNTQEIGGCPILNIGIHTSHTHPKLYEKTKAISKKLELGLESILNEGKRNNEINTAINPKSIARKIYAMIEGGIFMSYLHQDQSYLQEIINEIENIIITKISK